jgi:hypothetical protein
MDGDTINFVKSYNCVEIYVSGRVRRVHKALPKTKADRRNPKAIPLFTWREEVIDTFQAMTLRVPEVPKSKDRYLYLEMSQADWDIVFLSSVIKELKSNGVIE